MTLDPQQAGRLLGWLRVVAGAGAWLSPAQAGRWLGVSIAKDSPARPFVRLFGARDVIMGVGVLGAQTPGERDRYLLLGQAVDAADAVACLVGAGRQLPRRHALLGAALAAGAIALAARARAT